LKNAGLEDEEMGNEDQQEDDGIDWHDFVVVQTIDLFEQPRPHHSVVIERETEKER